MSQTKGSDATKNKLTPKQELFVQGLFKGLSQREAYKAAYDCQKWTDKSVDEKACVLANDVKIKSRLKELQDELKDRNMITVEWVLDNLKEVAERCMQATEVQQWDYEEKCLVGTGEYQFAHAGANKSLELIGKYLGMFTDKVESRNVNVNANAEVPDEEVDKVLQEYGII